MGASPILFAQALSMAAVICTAISVPGSFTAAMYGTAWVVLADPVVLHAASAVLAATWQSWCAALVNAGVAMYYYKDAAPTVESKRSPSPELMSYV